MMIEKGLGENILGTGLTTGDFGKSTLIVISVLKFFAKNLVNQVLGQVRSLSMITHFMMMQLMVPQNAMIFYSGLFELVTFEMIPTDVIYDELFGDSWKTEPFSERADFIGYSTRLVFSNLGSVTLIIAFLVLYQSILLVVSKLAREGGRTKTYVDAKRRSFFPGGLTDCLHEFYLCVSFAVCINFSQLEFKNAAVTFNSIFAMILATFLLLGPFAIAANVARQWKPRQVACEGLASPEGINNNNSYKARESSYQLEEREAE